MNYKHHIGEFKLTNNNTLCMFYVYSDIQVALILYLHELND